MALTPGQQKCVDTFVGPVSVSAGAGSGKTYTLTRRIVNAFEEGFIDDIGQVLAITFTSKAAGEIKSRVKGALKASGRPDQALLVDSAWISTIHGACSRILRAHALELGINPAFEIADEATAKTMLDESLEEVLGAENDLISPCGFDGLFEEYPASSSGFAAASSIEDMVRALVVHAGASPQGFSSLVAPPPVTGAHRLASRMVEVVSAALAAAGAQKQSAKRDEFLEKTSSALEHLEAAIGKESLSAKELAGLLNAFPAPARNFGSKEYKAQMLDVSQEYGLLASEARLALGEPRLAELVQLARLVSDAYARRKREAGLLDNDDLLTCASRMFAEHPEVAADYTNRFKLIMIDEFQDTDQMQVDMVKRMAGNGLERLCTVGDAQQSIYRFRGADVSVYNRHLKTVEQSNPAGAIVLSDNFRSHVDVLAFVDCIFSQPTVFGRSFMSLAAARSESRVKAPYRGSSPRIEVQLTTYCQGVSSDDARHEVARRIARRFAALREEGHNASDMVVLLGKMSRADVFAEALRDAGLPCVVSGGSIFSAAPEVQLMVRLAEVISNPKDTEALFEVLSSELFALSADDFVALSTGVDERRGIPRRVSLDKGMRLLAESGEAQRLASFALTRAVRLLASMEEAAGSVSVSSLMHRVVLDSGWLARLEGEGPEGLARAANVYKAIRMVESIESEKPLGPAGVAKEFRLRATVAKEAPGALSATSGDFVRIMTIHASKGLEFPIVAIADLRSDSARPQKLVSTEIGGKIYLSLDAGDSLSALPGGKNALVSKNSSFDPFAGDNELDGEALDALIENPADHTATEVRAAIRERERRGEAQESRRLLYVAITRAKEAVICAAMGKRTKTDETGLSKSAWHDIETALAGEESRFDPGVSMVEYGGDEPALVERVDLAPEKEQENADAPGLDRPGTPQASRDAQLSFIEIPAATLVAERKFGVPEPLRAGIYSYSSLARESHAGSALTQEQAQGSLGEELFPEAEAQSGFPSEFAADSDKATDLGTAFHRLAQYAVVLREARSALMCPNEDRIRALSRSCHLTALQDSRLRLALKHWFESSVARQVGGYESLRAEVPFFVQVGCGEGSPFLEGEIDLLASDGDGSRMLVVDYKTGGSPLEEEDALQGKYELQAKCYAYAALKQGASSVDLAFVRVEQLGEEGEPQVVSYSFAHGDMPSLESDILAAIDDCAA